MNPPNHTLIRVARDNFAQPYTYYFDTCLLRKSSSNRYFDRWLLGTNLSYRWVTSLHQRTYPSKMQISELQFFTTNILSLKPTYSKYIFEIYFDFKEEIFFSAFTLNLLIHSQNQLSNPMEGKHGGAKGKGKKRKADELVKQAMVRRYTVVTAPLRRGFNHHVFALLMCKGERKVPNPRCLLF